MSIDQGQVPTFLALLGLDSGADARAIKRAYAAELKRIDQETEAARFQDLREAYEIALEWHAHKAARQALEAPPDPGADAVPAPPEVPALPACPIDGASPDTLAAQAFEACRAALASLAQGRDANQVAPVRLALDQALAAEGLINVTARTIFEARIVHYLAAGWQPGNENLLVAAIDVFDWSRERRRLLQFGQAGALLDRAVAEGMVFYSHPETELLQKVVRRVRAPQAPTLPEIFERDNAWFEQIQGQFPVYMALVMDPARIALWQQRLASMRAKAAAHAEATLVFKPPRKDVGGIVALLVLGLIGVVRMFPGLLQTHEAPPPYEQRAPFAANAPSLGPPVPPQAPLLTEAMPVVEHGRAHGPRAQGPALTPQQMDDIQARINYTPGPQARERTLRVEFKVALDREGFVDTLDKLAGSGDARYDDAVARAIRGSKRFGQAPNARFTIWFERSRKPPL